MDKFKVGDRVVLARPDGYDAQWRGLSGGEVGVVVRIDDSGWPWVEFDGRDMPLSFLDDQLDPLDSVSPTTPSGGVLENSRDTSAGTTPPQRDDRRERIATAVLAGFASQPKPEAGLDLAGMAAQAAVEWADALIEELDR